MLSMTEAEKSPNLGEPQPAETSEQPKSSIRGILPNKRSEDFPDSNLSQSQIRNTPGKIASRAAGVLLSVFLSPLKVLVHHALLALLAALALGLSPLIGIVAVVYFLAEKSKMPIGSLVVGTPVGAALGGLAGCVLAVGVVAMELIMLPADIISHVRRGIRASLWSGYKFDHGGVGAWSDEFGYVQGMGPDYISNYLSVFGKRVELIWDTLCCRTCQTPVKGVRTNHTQHRAISAETYPYSEASEPVHTRLWKTSEEEALSAQNSRPLTVTDYKEQTSRNGQSRMCLMQGSPS